MIQSNFNRLARLIAGWAATLVAVSSLAAVAPPSAARKTEVFVSPATRTELFESLSYPARVTSLVNAQVLAETDGVVKRVMAPLGTRVRRDQDLFVIEHTDPVYQFAPVRVITPVAGAVSLIDVTQGSVVMKGQRLAIVTDPSQIRIQVEIAASDLQMFHRGLVGDLKLSGRDEPISVSVRGVSPLVDPATGTATAELEVSRVKVIKPATPTARAQLIPGMVGQVAFKADLRKGFSVPEHAIVYKERDPFVRLVVDGKAKRIPVTLGRTSRGRVEITKGLKDGDTVIERAAGYVTDGDEVSIQPPSQTGGG